MSIRRWNKREDVHKTPLNHEQKLLARFSAATRRQVSKGSR
jgi:hypothetical protein